MSEEQKPTEEQPEQMKRYQKVPSRFTMLCHECKELITAGTPIIWDTTEKHTYCTDCGNELMEAQRDDAG